MSECLINNQRNNIDKLMKLMLSKLECSLSIPIFKLDLRSNIISVVALLGSKKQHNIKIVL